MSLNHNPFFSVIIPVYRAQACIERAVKSLITQTYPHFEALLVVDDGDDYASLLANKKLLDPRLRFISTHGYGLGAAKARNLGRRYAIGQYLACLDADDAYLPDTLKSISTLITKHPAILLDYQLRDFVTGSPLHKEPLDTIPLGPLSPDIFFNIAGFKCSQLFFDPLIVRNYWDERFPLLEDYLFALQIAELPGLFYYSATEPLYLCYLRSNEQCNQFIANNIFLKNANRLLIHLEQSPGNLLKISHERLLGDWLQTRIQNTQALLSPNPRPYQLL